jgi:acyl-CoA synthetase (AMP-forming)/AMP-acid ligase II
VYGVPHEDFGSVLNAVVELRDGVSLTEEELKGWVRTKLSRAEMPHHIEFRKIDVLSTGKRMKIS